jgi:mycothiol synthase
MADLQLRISNRPAIAGLRFRRYRGVADYQAIADLVEISHLADGDEYLPDAASLRIDYEHTTGFDASRDFLFAEADGQLVGYGAVDRQERTKVVYHMTGTVHPAYRRRGLGRAILRRNEARLLEIAAGHPNDAGREFGTDIGDREAGAHELLVSEGYRPVRHYFAMLRPNLHQLPEAPAPDGLELRALEPAHHRAVFEASNEAFRDHWDHRESTEEDFTGFFETPDLEPELCRIAWAGHEVAGSVLTFVWKNENAKHGVRRAWFERISVRRPWRQRGLARAMIVSSMAAIRDGGLDAAMLGVDTENPTGALRLYESLGFVVNDTGTSFRKDWRSITAARRPHHRRSWRSAPKRRLTGRRGGNHDAFHDHQHRVQRWRGDPAQVQLRR